MAMLGLKDGEGGSYPEMVDALARHGADAKRDARASYRRVAFNVLVSNVDDHLRSHGFLRMNRSGWTLSLAYDLNPVAADLKARILTTNIDLEESTCSLDLLEASAGYFALSLCEARVILKRVASATSTWREVARQVSAPVVHQERQCGCLRIALVFFFHPATLSSAISRRATAAASLHRPHIPPAKDEYCRG
jgi:serine/threonine-protein kinase HipA